jgi:ATP-dependent DNA helicase RecQ
MYPALKKYFGYDSLRPSQIPIIESIMSGQDTLGIMPTGGGKSMCYQLPALLKPGFTVVICPLIALMHDQVTALKENGIWAEYINSSQDIEVQNEIITNLNNLRNESNLEPNQQIKLLYISPEKLMANDASFLQYLGTLPVDLYAIDEAHCISTWGHEFRPEYTQLAIIKEYYPEIPLIALTATADKLTRNDIQRKLNINKSKVFISSFDRPNIYYQVTARDKPMDQIKLFINEWQGQAGIVYCISRKSVEEVASKLRAMGIKALAYHAGMLTDDKNHAFKEFMSDNIQVIVATVAFGMGIDKSNVRWVIHYNMPKNIESYYQETGRAGRDGLPSQAMLLYNASDMFTLRDFIDRGTAPSHLTNDEVKAFKTIQHDKLNRLGDFSQTHHCRRKILLQYFEETMVEDCGNCDCCTNPAKLFDGTIVTQKILSAVGRTNQKFGIHHIVDVLRGEKTDKVVSFNHDTLPTFGASHDLSKDELLNYINQLINLGYLGLQYEGFMKSLILNDKSLSVLKSELQVNLSIYEVKTKLKKEKLTKSTTKFDLAPEDQELFDSLKSIRTKIAKEENVPPYVVFHDATLVQMATLKPKTEIEFLELSGVGASKLNKYGIDFMEGIKKLV